MNSVHCSRCVCVCACVCPLLQVCVCFWISQIQRTQFTADYTLYNYVCDKKKNYGKLLKYREKYRSTDISVDL